MVAVRCARWTTTATLRGAQRSSTTRPTSLRSTPTPGSPTRRAHLRRLLICSLGPVCYMGVVVAGCPWLCRNLMVPSSRSTSHAIRATADSTADLLILAWQHASSVIPSSSVEPEQKQSNMLFHSWAPCEPCEQRCDCGAGAAAAEGARAGDRSGGAGAQEVRARHLRPARPPGQPHAHPCTATTRCKYKLFIGTGSSSSLARWWPSALMSYLLVRCPFLPAMVWAAGQM